MQDTLKSASNSEIACPDRSRPPLKILSSCFGLDYRYLDPGRSYVACPLRSLVNASASRLALPWFATTIFKKAVSDGA